MRRNVPWWVLALLLLPLLACDPGSGKKSGGNATDGVQPPPLSSDNAEISSDQAQNDELELLIMAVEKAKGAEKLRYLTHLWEASVDANAPDETLSAFERFAKDPDDEVSRLAWEALIDLGDLREAAASVAKSGGNDAPEKFTPGTKTQDGIKDSGVPQSPNVEKELITTRSKKRLMWKKLWFKVLHGKGETERASALRRVALESGPESVNILLAGAADENANVRLIAIQNLWHSAAKGLDENGRILMALQDAVWGSDPIVAGLAQRALDDLERLAQMRAEEEWQASLAPEWNSQSNRHNWEITNSDPNTLAMSQPPESGPNWEVLAQRAFYELNTQARSESIREVAHYRSEKAVDILLEVATYDGASQNRYQAVEALWRSAANGLDSDGRITDTLQNALRDSDPQIAKLAERAIEDLQQLAERRFQHSKVETATLSDSEDSYNGSPDRVPTQ
ncbi:MAG: hypothetical protein FVQ81_17905 [Candidatus Glassbacteria bacterium]|nr:hypothetical protein [Candidatus Glassbacteria bacterium]